MNRYCNVHTYTYISTYVSAYMSTCIFTYICEYICAVDAYVSNVLYIQQYKVSA